MNVLIVENEIYLAQSIAGKLIDNGHTPYITSSIDEVMERSDEAMKLDSRSDRVEQSHIMSAKNTSRDIMGRNGTGTSRDINSASTGIDRDGEGRNGTGSTSKNIVGRNITGRSKNKAMSEEKNGFDIVLLSMNTAGVYYMDIVERYRDCIVILMVSYVSDDTVSKPLKMGAKDYIVKPFMMDELVRKIEHYIVFKDLEEDIDFYKSYFLFIQNELQLPLPAYYDLPFLIKTSTQRSADIYAMKYAIERRMRLEFINLKSINLQEYRFDKNKNYYVTNCENLKKNERKDFLEKALNHNMIISMITNDDISFPNIADISDMTSSFEIGSDILSLQDYEKAVISKFDERYSDVELAKKLGMSRKSLWEKRKKYGITRKK